MQLTELGGHLDTLLDASRLKDYCPNGLQVEGRAEVRRVLCGVTASQALLDLAATGAYDAVFVHHGLFWKGDDGRVTGFRRRRLHTLLANDISLFAYHLPLDVHPELGNNAQLARLMGWQGTARFADQELGWIGRPAREGERADEIARALARPTGRARRGGAVP
ncbi:MAG TPA: Nif3-like dinuclear metal center hexameric protein, partial [Thauera aminoaromatica]|nr:Nif3-like dinuclear metal center hexameric protein [Thauera aminoaromatica]